MMSSFKEELNFRPDRQCPPDFVKGQGFEGGILLHFRLKILVLIFIQHDHASTYISFFWHFIICLALCTSPRNLPLIYTYVHVHVAAKSITGKPSPYLWANRFHQLPLLKDKGNIHAGASTTRTLVHSFHLNQFGPLSLESTVNLPNKLLNSSN